MLKNNIILILILLLLPLVLAQDSPPGLPPVLNQDPGNVLGTVKYEGKVSLDYLGQELQKAMLENKYIAGINSFFSQKAVSFIFFKIPFGQEYSLSFTLLLIIIIWLYFFFMLGGIFKNYSSFSSAISYGITALMLIIASQLKIIETFAKFLIWIALGDKPWWYSLISFIIIAAAFIFLYQFMKVFGDQIKENREKMKEAMHKADIELGAKSGKALTKAISKS
ncbi:MAG: hypothetical protein ABIH72_05155 [archaeon]